MSVVLHIERLVLEGLPVAQRDRPALVEAVEGELARRLAAERGWPAQGAEVRSLHGSPLRLGGGPVTLGTAIAGSIHSAVRP
jgi:hypothetical protein